MTNFNQQQQKVNTQINAQGNVYISVYTTPDIAALMERAIRSLKSKRYDDAIRTLDIVIQNDDSIPEAFYYYAVALLKGDSPRYTTRPVADKMEQELSRACELDPEQAHYYYLRALVKYDFFAVNGFRTHSPDAQTLVNIAYNYPIDIYKCHEMLEHTDSTESVIAQIIQQRL